jgi:hypothetical protein
VAKPEAWCSQFDLRHGVAEPEAWCSRADLRHGVAEPEAQTNLLYHPAWYNESVIPPCMV